MNQVFRVTASRLNLRIQPDSGSQSLVKLPHGQAVARLDNNEWGSWWYVFADTPGAGVFVGYVHSGYLERWDDADSSFIAQPFNPSPTPAPSPAPSPSPAPTGGEWTDGWNPAVPAAQRVDTRIFSDRPSGTSIQRVVMHVTGTTDFDTVKSRFKSAASAHYVIDMEGKLFQFVSEDKKAWHAGIQKEIINLYKKDDRTWRKYMRYFSWYRGYPSDAVYVDSGLNPVADKSSAKLVMRADGSEWPEYAYFDARWPGRNQPIGFEQTTNPNNNSIGIEILSIGHKNQDPNHYTDAMYATTANLVDDICRRHGLSKEMGVVCGHEDVNPVERWGWDPNSGFEWAKILS